MYVSNNTQQYAEPPAGEEAGRFKVENQHVQQALEDCMMKVEATENAVRCRTPTGPEIEEEKEGYVSYRFFKYFFGRHQGRAGLGW